MAKVSTLVLNTDNASDWSKVETGTGSVVTLNDTEVTTDIPNDGNNYEASYVTSSTWDIGDSAVYVFMTAPVAYDSSNFRDSTLFNVEVDADNYVRWRMQNTTGDSVVGEKVIGGSSSTETAGLSLSSHGPWLRLRCVTGANNTYYWDTSPGTLVSGPTNWTPRGDWEDTASDISPSAVRVRLRRYQTFTGSDKTQSETVWDKLNESPASGALAPHGYVLKFS